MTALLACGCAAGPQRPAAEAIQLQAPVVQPEQAVSTEVTSLQRYQELNRLCEAQKSQNAALEASLAEQKAGRQKAEAENENLRKQVEALSAKAGELDAVKAKLEEAQKASLDLENAVRDARRELLQERLAGVKRDQVIVALKIEKAREARKPGAGALSIPDRGADKSAPAAAPPAPPKASQPQVQAEKAAPPPTAEKETEVAKP